ncbi:MAG: hypothetical protein LBL86_01510 [Coriobacteriales bacterium]|nr:hypothetical protein [Coriobacteriales bacterium]
MNSNDCPVTIVALPLTAHVNIALGLGAPETTVHASGLVALVYDTCTNSAIDSAGFDAQKELALVR